MSEVLLLGNFAAAMAERLDANSHKRGWRHLSAKRLLVRLRQEVGELERALESEAETVGEYVRRVTHEAADVANFAAMIADVVREQALRDDALVEEPAHDA